MTSDSLLFLDFDGVICDSIDECLVSSWAAFHTLRGEKRPAAMDRSHRSRFARLRPFIRSGEDYVLIQGLIAEGVRIDSQQEFDRRLAGVGPQGMESYKDIFYQARAEILAEDRSWWLSLNRVYPHVLPVLRLLADLPAVYVMSTKKSAFIVEILAAAGVSIPVERVIYSGSERKVLLVAAELDRLGASEAVLLDDQIDHLVGVIDPRVRVRLALWGYIQPEWRQAPVPQLDVEGWEEFAAQWITALRPGAGS